MSLQQQARALIEQAGTAIQSGNPQYAIELLRQAILYNGKDGEAYILLGIALAQTGLAADAENALVKATELAPNNVKAWYNLAVHQYAEGQVRAALASARQAAELDALHAGSRDLAARIESELGIAPGEQPKTSAAGNPTVQYPREGYEEQDVQTMPGIARLEPYWTLAGWALAAISLVLFVLTLTVVVPFMSSHAGTSDTAVKAMSEHPLIAKIQPFYFVGNLLSLIFVAMDAINKRGNLLWVLPQVVCGCTGFTWVILPIYLLTGRNK